ncbi:hypothetical protein T439DRAFT_330554 [Meredithblackwellia eburnea MCA 4105]
MYALAVSPLLVLPRKTDEEYGLSFVSLFTLRPSFSLQFQAKRRLYYTLIPPVSFVNLMNRSFRQRTRRGQALALRLRTTLGGDSITRQQQEHSLAASPFIPIERKQKAVVYRTLGEAGESDQQKPPSLKIILDNLQRKKDLETTATYLKGSHMDVLAELAEEETKTPLRAHLNVFETKNPSVEEIFKSNKKNLAKVSHLALVNMNVKDFKEETRVLFRQSAVLHNLQDLTIVNSSIRLLHLPDVDTLKYLRLKNSRFEGGVPGFNFSHAYRKDHTFEAVAFDNSMVSFFFTMDRFLDHSNADRKIFIRKLSIRATATGSLNSLNQDNGIKLATMVVKAATQTSSIQPFLQHLHLELLDFKTTDLHFKGDAESNLSQFTFDLTTLQEDNGTYWQTIHHILSISRNTLRHVGVRLDLERPGALRNFESLLEELELIKKRNTNKAMKGIEELTLIGKHFPSCPSLLPFLPQSTALKNLYSVCNDLKKAMFPLSWARNLIPNCKNIKNLEAYLSPEPRLFEEELYFALQLSETGSEFSSLKPRNGASPDNLWKSEEMRGWPKTQLLVPRAKWVDAELRPVWQKLWEVSRAQAPAFKAVPYTFDTEFAERFDLRCPTWRRESGLVNLGECSGVLTKSRSRCIYSPEPENKDAMCTLHGADWQFAFPTPSKENIGSKVCKPEPFANSIISDCVR